MIHYLLDTNTVTLLRHGHHRIVANVTSHSSDTIGITVVNVEEILAGWFTRVRQAKTKAAQAAASRLLANATMHLGQFPIFPLTETSIDEYERLVRLKLNIGAMNLRIAAIALELGAIVVTNNIRDFGRVPGLSVEDWAL